MTEGEKRQKKKLRRTETIGFRLEPKLRFAAELAARKQRRSLSSFIEWAVEEAIKKVVLKTYESYNHPDREETAYDAINLAWDVDEADRFAKLALYLPELLTHDEEILWKLICENGYLWKGSFWENRARGVSEWTWEVRPKGMIYDRLRDNWEIFKKVANEELPKDQLPGWEKERPLEEEEDDDIPF